MKYEQPKYTRSATDRAWRNFILDSNNKEASSHAYDVVSNWRASHFFPLANIWMTLNNRAKKVDPTADVVSRVKRLESIGRKLIVDMNSTRLTQLQDIGGCRAICQDISDAINLRDIYRRRKLAHKFHGERDYIFGDPGPKSDGYRGFHLIYRYGSKNASAAPYLGMLIEIQIRTRLQHVWATAVEASNIFSRARYNQTPNFVRQAAEVRFFALASHCIAEIEQCAGIPGCPDDIGEAKRELASINAEYQFLQTLQQYKTTIAEVVESRGKNTHYLVELDPINEQIRLMGFQEDQTIQASRMFFSQEQLNLVQSGSLEKMSDKINIALLSSRSVADLMRAYPNYFGDTAQFVGLVQGFINEA